MSKRMFKLNTYRDFIYKLGHNKLDYTIYDGMKGRRSKQYTALMYRLTIIRHNELPVLYPDAYYRFADKFRSKKHQDFDHE